jgi:N-acetylgalactosamine kinase
MCGMDMIFSGNIPVAAGLSSSSAMVVATAEAAVALNGLVVSPQDFVDLCGEGEWFVGSRGGAGDHAAMKFGVKGSVSQIGFFPFALKRSIFFPSGFRLVIADSHVKAKKSANAKDLFNQRIAEYEYSLDLFKAIHPEAADRIGRVRDINPETLECPPSRIYEMLAELPAGATLDELRARFPGEYEARITKLSATHAAPASYALRPVLLYGIAECRRSWIAGDLLERGEIADFGAMMQVSHDGDRVVRRLDGKVEPYASAFDDAYLHRLVADLRSEDPRRVAAAQLERQPGGYACSTEETDILVDIALATPGVAGAQLSGAGLGGCVMILVREQSLEVLLASLNRDYYEQRRLEPGTTVCLPVQGSMALEI